MSRSLTQTVTQPADLTGGPLLVLDYTHNEATTQASVVLIVGESGGEVAAGATITPAVTVGGAQMPAPDPLTASGAAVLRFDMPGVTLKQAERVTVTVESDNPADSSLRIDVQVLTHAEDPAWTDERKSLVDGAAQAGDLERLSRGGGELILASTGAGTGAADLLGRYPVVGSADYLREVTAVADFWSSSQPVERATTYYFDADNGSDANDGLTALTPKQTVAAMNALFAAGDVTVRATGTWRLASGERPVVDNNSTLTNWRGGAWPVFTHARLSIAAGSAAWTLAAGNRWTATLASADWVRPSTWTSPFAELTIANSAAECEANDDSFWIDGSTVHVNLGGDDPNALPWEATHTADYGSDASGVEIAGPGRVENVVCHHNGYSAYQTGANQSYGIKCNQVNEEVAVVRNVVSAGHRYHSIGTFNVNAGGRTLVENARVGGCRDNTATYLNFFAPAGGNEAIARGCTFVDGRTPEVDMDERSSQAGVFGHTSVGGALVDFAAIVDCHVSPGGRNPLQFLGRMGDIQADGEDLANVRCCFYGCTQQPTEGSWTVPLLGDHAYVACDIRVKPRFRSQLGLTNLTPGGWLIASRWEVDCSLLSGATYGVFTSDTPITNVHAINSAIRWANIPSGTTFYGYRLVGPFGTAPTLVNNVWEATGDGGAYLALGDHESDTSRVTNNALIGFTTSPTGDLGYSSWNNTQTIAGPVGLDAPLTGLAGDTALGSACGVDGSGEPLLRPGSHVGPFGPAVETLNTLSAPALTAEQETLLSGAATQASVDSGFTAAAGNEAATLAAIGALPPPLTSAETEAAAAAGVLETPANKLTTDGSGQVTATNGGGSGGSGPTTDVEDANLADARVAVLRRTGTKLRSVEPLYLAAGENGDHAPLCAASFAGDLSPGGRVQSVASIDVTQPDGAAAGSLTVVGDLKRDKEHARFQLAAADDATPGDYTLTIKVTYSDGSGGAVGVVDVRVS